MRQNRGSAHREYRHFYAAHIDKFHLSESMLAKSRLSGSIQRWNERCTQALQTLKGTLAEHTAAKRCLACLRLELGDVMSAVNQTKEILVIEDDQASREAICDLLEMEGYLVASVSNGQEGLDHLRLDYSRQESRTGLILLDLSMPVMDGWEFLQRLQTETCPRPPVVVMSAGVSASPTDAQAVLRKPVNIDQLMSTIAASFDSN